MGRKKPRQFTGKQKVNIIREHLIEKKTVSEVCEAHAINPTMYYRWQKQFFEGGEAAFEKRQNEEGEFGRLRQEIKQLEQKVMKKNEVLGELMEEHIELKKKFGGR